MDDNSVTKNSPVPNASFFREVECLLRRHIKVAINVQGGSMRPFLRNGDKVLLIPARRKKISRGDIVLAHTSGGVLLHRVVRMRREEIWLSGDANSRQLEHITKSDIIGIVDTAWRKESILCINSFPRRILAFFWYLLRPFRGYILGACYRLKHIKKRMI